MPATIPATSLPGLAFRVRNDADAPFEHALYALTRDDLRAMPMPADFIADLISMQQQIQATGQRNAFPHAAYWIVEWQAQPVGRVVVDMVGAEWRLVDIAIAPAARRRGFGGAILRALQASAADRQAAIGLAVARANDGARRLYEAAGFVVRGADPLQEQMLWPAPR